MTLQDKSSKSTSLYSEYDNVFIFGDCFNPLLFLRNDAYVKWQFKGKDWKFSKLNINSFDEISNDVLLNSVYRSSLSKSYDGSIIRNNIAIGDYVIAKNAARVNIRYVFKLIDHSGDHVKLDCKSYRIKDSNFFSLNNTDQLNQVILNSDIETLEELVQEHQSNINICEQFLKMEIKTTPLTFAMEKSKKEIFNKLIELGADINQGCRENRTTLMYSTLR